MFFIRSMRLLIRAFTAECSHRQIAWAIGCGFLVGMVPKGNLLALGLLTAVSAFRISLPALFFSTFLCSWLALYFDPMSHALGEWVLTHETLVPIWTWLYEQPLLPWTNFNNTIVMGSTLIGLCGCYPVYRLTLPVVIKYEPGITTRIRKYRITKWLYGAEWLERLRAAT